MDDQSFLYLSRRDIEGIALTRREIVDVLKATLAEHGRGTVQMPPNLHLAPHPNSEIDGMAAFVPSSPALGLKWVGSFPGNLDLGLPQTTALLIMNDVKTGLPVAVLEAGRLTALRTAAVTAISAAHLAKRDPRILGVIGCGVQGRSNLLALADCFPFEEVRAFDIRHEAATRYAAEMGSQVTANIRVATTPRHAVEGCDIVLTATATLNRPAPFIRDEWLSPGALAVPLDVDSVWESRTIRGVDKYVTDTRKHIEAYAHHGSFPDGLPTIHAEIGQIVAGLKPGRERTDERIMVMNTGMAIEDVSLGKVVYERALRAGVGVRLPLN
jgi:ornithine cyclodeaminase/alanine dehydrogenase-like protein (mu-crystallin family)